MISRMGASAAAWLVVSALLSGAVPAAAAVDGPSRDVPASTPVAQGPVRAPSSAVPSEAASSETAGDGEGTLVEMPLVVPAVDGGAVEESSEVRAARVDEDTVLAEDVVDAERVASDVVETDEFQTVGVTWPEDADVATLDPYLRVRTDGEWSEWTELGQDGESPDAGTADAAHATRGGTEPVWVGDADAVQLSFAAGDEAGPDGLALVLVGSDEVALAPDDAIVGQVATSDVDVEQASFIQASSSQTPFTQMLAAVSPAPTIISRAQWGARDQVCTPDVASRLVGAAVHHTAGSNNYATVAEAMQQIRNDQRYHIESRGWCDLGYNFVVDKWGNIYEGRARSLTQPVVGVHAGGFNTGTVGVSMLGTYGVAPSAATQQAVGQIIGWRLGSYGVNPATSMVYHTGTGENSKFQDEDVSLPRVFGHRDVAYTACPGDGGYAALPAIRAVAEEFSSQARLAQAESVIRAMYADLLGRQPEARGLADWSFGLLRGVPAQNIAASITQSEEYNRRKISEAYRTVLGRGTDEPGVLSWLAAIRVGTVKIDQIANHLVASKEFYLRSGGTDAGLVGAMYTSLLGRTGSADEIRYWTSRVPSMGRGGVIAAVTGSREAAQRRVQINYRLFLNRLPDVAGQSLWTDVALAQGEAAVRASLVGSEEYRLRSIARFFDYGS